MITAGIKLEKQCSQSSELLSTDGRNTATKNSNDCSIKADSNRYRNVNTVITYLLKGDGMRYILVLHTCVYIYIYICIYIYTHIINTDLPVYLQVHICVQTVYKRNIRKRRRRERDRERERDCQLKREREEVGIPESAGCGKACFPLYDDCRRTFLRPRVQGMRPSPVQPGLGECPAQGEKSSSTLHGNLRPEP